MSELEIKDLRKAGVVCLPLAFKATAILSLEWMRSATIASR